MRGSSTPHSACFENCESSRPEPGDSLTGSAGGEFVRPKDPAGSLNVEPADSRMETELTTLGTIRTQFNKNARWLLATGVT